MSKPNPSTKRKKKKAIGVIYREAAENLRGWLKPNLKAGYPKRSLDDDLAHAASLLDAAGTLADNIDARLGL